MASLNFLESPLNKYCYQMDKKLLGSSLFDYYDFVEQVDFNYLTNLLLEDFKFRYSTQQNVLMEIYGQQRSGKSIFGQNMAGNLGQIYEMPFNMENHTLSDFDMLDNVLHNTPFRTTFIVDEQPLAFFGYGSTRTQKSLKDYEEICAYTMKNIIYISPSEREHSSYYVFKEDMLPSVERFKNETCLTCSQQKECLKIYSETKFKTLCGIPFYERHGYPVAFRFMLIMPRKSDNHLMPRGYVHFPVLPPAMMQRYDKIKNRNIDAFEKKKTFGWQEQRRLLREFQEKFKDKIVHDGKIVSKSLIKAYLQDYFGGRAFTTGELDMFAVLIKAEILNGGFVDDLQNKINEELDIEFG